MKETSDTETSPRLVGDRSIEEVVLPVATGSHRDRAMPFAAELAAVWDLPIRVVHVSESVSSVDPDLNEIVEELKPWYPEARIESQHLYGEDPARTIADDLGPHSLAVLSTEHANGWKYKSSAAEAVVNAAGVPVMLVGPHARIPRLKGEVVVGLDGSGSAEDGLDSAVGLAQSLGRRLWLVSVVPEPVEGEPDAHPHIGRYLQDLAESYESTVPTRWEVIQSNDPVAAIDSFVNRRDAGFMVASTSGRADPSRHSMCSITMRLVSVLSCPVLTSRSAPADVNLEG